MAERLGFPVQGRRPEFDKKVLEISDLPQGPESVLFGLTRVTNLAVERMDIPETPLKYFKDKLNTISSPTGKKSHTLVLCNAGVLRSKLLADYLFKNQLVKLETLNMNKRRNGAKGLGVNGGLTDFEFDFSEGGIAIVDRVGIDRKIDLLILALAGSDKDPLDSQALGRMASFLNDGLESINGFNHPFDILWLNGIESEFTQWISDSVKR